MVNGDKKCFGIVKKEGTKRTVEEKKKERERVKKMNRKFVRVKELGSRKNKLKNG